MSHPRRFGEPPVSSIMIYPELDSKWMTRAKELFPEADVRPREEGS